MRLFFESADPAADLPFAGPLTAESEPEETLIVRDATLVRGPTEWADISVYRGTCDLDHSGKPKSVVCKVGFDDDQRFLPKEWAVYQNLISLQGKYIPIAYRLVAGSTEIGDATCLMLEDCGEPLSNFFHKYPLELKGRIYEAARAIHKANYRHGDLNEGNVLLDSKGDVRIIDFDCAESMVCDVKIEITPGDFKPPPEDFDCTELQELCRSLGILRPKVINFYGEFVPIAIATNAYQLAKYATGVAPDKALKDASKTIMAYLEHYCHEQYLDIIQNPTDYDDGPPPEWKDRSATAIPSK